jgi:hypothetical protein
MLNNNAKKGKETIRIFGACDPMSIALNPKRAVIKAEKKCALRHIEVWYSFAKDLCSASKARKSSSFICLYPCMWIGVACMLNFQNVNDLG